MKILIIRILEYLLGSPSNRASTDTTNNNYESPKAKQLNNNSTTPNNNNNNTPSNNSPLSVIDLITSPSANTSQDEIEEYYDVLWKDKLMNSSFEYTRNPNDTSYDIIDSSLDNYYAIVDDEKLQLMGLSPVSSPTKATKNNLNQKEDVQ